MVLGTRSFSRRRPGPQPVRQHRDPLAVPAGHRRARPGHPDRPARLPGGHAPWLAGRPRRALRVRAESPARGQAGRLPDPHAWTSPPSTWTTTAGSHFRPVADSVRIYAPLLKFLASSLAAFVIDTVAFLVLSAGTGSVLVAVVGGPRPQLGGELRSSTGRLVFEHGRDKPAASTGARYFALVVALLAANFALMSALDRLPCLPFAGQAPGRSCPARRQLRRAAAVPLLPGNRHTPAAAGERRINSDSYSSHGSATAPAQLGRES